MRLAALALSLFAITTCSYGQEAASSKSRATSSELFASSPTVNLLDSIGVEVNKNGSGKFTIHKVIKIQSVEGELANRVIKYDYDPLTAFAKFDKVTIYKADGTSHKLDLSKACDYAAPARAIYWGARQIMVEIGRLEVGDVIDYTIDKSGFTYALLADMPSSSDDDRFIPPMRGEYYDIVPFWVDVPTIKKVYSVSLPNDKPVQYEFYQGECAVAVTGGESTNTYMFTKSDLLPFTKEPNMVDRFDIAPKLMMSTTPNWQEKSKWFHKVNEDYGSFEPYAPAQKMVDKLTASCRTNMEKIAVLTHWVADNMRYSGISMGEGEGYTLHNTEMNFTDRAGVCKDKAALLISMLRMAGLEAYPAMTMAGSRIEAIPADHFNHCVAVVKSDEGVYIPLDPTWVPFNRELWSSAEQQQNYLPGTPEPSDLCLTPLSAPENHYLRMKSSSTLSADGTLKGSITVSAEGQSDNSVRYPFTLGYRNQWQHAMEIEIKSISPEAKLISVDYGDDPKDYQKSAIEITFTFEIPNYAIVGDDEMIIKPVTMSAIYSGVRSYLKQDLSLESREYGFKDRCSRLIELEESITLPKGYSMISGSKEEQCSSDAATFSGSIRSEGGKITTNQSLALYKRVYKAEDWSGYKESVSTHSSFGNDIVIKR